MGGGSSKPPETGTDLWGRDYTKAPSDQQMISDQVRGYASKTVGTVVGATTGNPYTGLAANVGTDLACRAVDTEAQMHAEAFNQGREGGLTELEAVKYADLKTGQLEPGDMWDLKMPVLPTDAAASMPPPDLQVPFEAPPTAPPPDPTTGTGGGGWGW